jgi:hypothetical protein
MPEVLVSDFNDYNFFIVFHDGEYIKNIIGTINEPSDNDIERYKTDLFFSSKHNYSDKEFNRLKSSVVGKDVGLKIVQDMMGPKPEDTIH